MPSSSIDNCAGVNDTLALKDANGTEQAVSFSSVLQNEQLVAVIEPGRLGGRLRSKPFEGAEGVIAELGAMRFPVSSTTFYHYLGLAGLRSPLLAHANFAGANLQGADLRGAALGAAEEPTPPKMGRVAAPVVEVPISFVDRVRGTSKMSLWIVGEAIRLVTRLLAPFAPHLAEELWQALGHDKSLAYEPWPAFDEAEVPI